MRAMNKDKLEIDAIVLCPDCGSESELRVSRKEGVAKLECSECGIVERGVIPYGAGVVLRKQ